MTAVPLFDLLHSAARNGVPGGHVSAADERLVAVAEQMVASALDDYRHIRELDEAFAPDEQHPFNRQVATLLRQMYEKWSADADGVMARVAELREGDRIGGAGELRDAIGRTRAMLSVSLADLDEGADQIRRGQTRTAEEVRRELRLGTQR